MKSIIHLYVYSSNFARCTVNKALSRIIFPALFLFFLSIKLVAQTTPANSSFNQQNYPSNVPGVNFPNVVNRVACHSMQFNDVALPNFGDIIEVHAWNCFSYEI